MVDSQIRPNKVTDPRILAAMRRLPRERFLPPAWRALAYADAGRAARRRPGADAADGDRPAGADRWRSPQGERALVVGGGPGYGAALLAACGARVTALEDDPALLALPGRR